MVKELILKKFLTYEEDNENEVIKKHFITESGNIHYIGEIDENGKSDIKNYPSEKGRMEIFGLHNINMSSTLNFKRVSIYNGLPYYNNNLVNKNGKYLVKVNIKSLESNTRYTGETDFDSIGKYKKIHYRQYVALVNEKTREIIALFDIDRIEKELIFNVFLMKGLYSFYCTNDGTSFENVIFTRQQYHQIDGKKLYETLDEEVVNNQCKWVSQQVSNRKMSNKLFKDCKYINILVRIKEKQKDSTNGDFSFDYMFYNSTTHNISFENNKIVVKESSIDLVDFLDNIFDKIKKRHSLHPIIDEKLYCGKYGIIKHFLDQIDSGIIDNIYYNESNRQEKIRLIERRLNKLYKENIDSSIDDLKEYSRKLSQQSQDLLYENEFCQMYIMDMIKNGNKDKAKNLVSI